MLTQIFICAKIYVGMFEYLIMPKETINNNAQKELSQTEYDGSFVCYIPSGLETEFLKK